MTSARQLRDLDTALAGRSVVVYGGTGVIGSAIIARVCRARMAARDATPVYVLSRVRPLAMPAGVQHVSGSILDAGVELPAAALAIYVVGTTSAYLDDPATTIQLASSGVDRFLVANRSAAGRVVVGSARIYGPRTEAAALDESDLCRLRSPDLRNIYDGAKLVSEALARRASSADQPVMVVRLGNVYGGAIKRDTRTAFADFLQQAHREGRITVRGAPAAIRNHVHAADAAEGILRVVAFGGHAEAYNIGSHDHMTNEEFARAIAAACPRPVAVELAAPETMADHMMISIDKARRLLGYEPSCPIASALAPEVRAGWERL